MYTYKLYFFENKQKQAQDKGVQPKNIVYQFDLHCEHKGDHKFLSMK
jgi:hypothetical protein